MRARCIDAVGVTFSKQKPRCGRTQINYSHSLEAGEGSRPSGRGEVGSDVTSPPERKRRARHPSLDCSVETCGIGGAKRDTTLVGWGRNVLDREVGRSRRGRAFQRFLSGIKRCRYSEKNVYFLTLTSSPECGYEFLKRDWIVLLKICREFFGQFGYCMIKTREVMASSICFSILNVVILSVWTLFMPSFRRIGLKYIGRRSCGYARRMEIHDWRVI